MGSSAFAGSLKPAPGAVAYVQNAAAAPKPGDSQAAAPAPAPAPSTAATDDDDESAPQPLEPDFTIINLPTTLRLPEHKADFRLIHRFQGNLTQGNFGFQLQNLFGLDEGATISLELRYGVMKHLEAVVARSNFDRTIDFYGKYDGWKQAGSMPVGISAIGSVEGANNFRRDYAPAFGASVSRTLGGIAAVYATPFWVHNSAALSGVTRDTGFIGIGGRVKIANNTYVVGEVSPRIGGYAPGNPEYGFALEKRVGGHVFQLNFTNGAATTFAQIARGGFPDSLYLGFNLSRKFF
jgi:hypothetical protein